MKKIIFGVIFVGVILVGWIIYSHTESYLITKAVTQNKPELCNKIVVPNSTSSGLPAVDTTKCITEVAIKNKNIEACTYIANAFTTDLYNCFTQVSFAPKTDSIVCNNDKIRDHGGCYAQFAIKANDKNICLGLADVNTRDRCISDYIKILKLYDLDLCNQINNQEYKNICISNFAYHTHNSNACQNISDEKNREKCITEAK